MSYYVRFKVAWGRAGFSPLIKEARDKVLSCVEEYLRAEGTYDVDGWREEFHDAFLGKGAEIKVLDEEWAIEMLTFVSGRFPGVTFRARGRGEELGDAWALRCRDGAIVGEASCDGERTGVVRRVVPASAWPRPLEIFRVVREAGSRLFIAEILGGQPLTAEVAALTIKPSTGRKPRALVYVGPLEQEGYERVRDLIDNRYRVQQFRDVRSLSKQPTATADDPRGY